MPQLDLDHVFCVGARGRGGSVCETAPASAAQRGGNASASARTDDDYGDDAPAESVLIPLRGGNGLAELLCAALRRDASTKGSSNPKAAAEAAARMQGAPRAESRRLPGTTASKAAAVVIIGVLPAAAGKVVANAKERRAPGPGRAWRRPAAGARVFASEATGPEPVSPKVSCFGAVLPESRGGAAALSGNTNKQGEGEERGGCWASVAAALRGLCRNSDPPGEGGESGASESSPKAAAAPEPPPAAVLSPPRAVAGLGDVKRLASRRWTETLAADAEGRGSV